MLNGQSWVIHQAVIIKWMWGFQFSLAQKVCITETNHGTTQKCCLKNVKSVSFAAVDKIDRASSCQNHLRLKAKKPTKFFRYGKEDMIVVYILR